MLASYGVALYGFCKRHTVGTCHICVYKPRHSQITQYGEDAAGAVYIVDMVSGVWRYFAQHRRFPRQEVYVVEGEINAALGSDSKEVQHGVCGAAHRNIHRHGVEHGASVGDKAGQYRLVAVAVICLSHFHYAGACFLQEQASVCVGGGDSAVSGERKAEGFSKAVHRVGREHSGAGTAGGTCPSFESQQAFVANIIVGRAYHNVHEIYGLAVDDTGLHRASRHKYGRYVEPHRGYEHAGCYLVAVRYAHHCVGAVCVYHIFYRVGNQLARGQGI